MFDPSGFVPPKYFTTTVVRRRYSSLQSTGMRSARCMLYVHMYRLTHCDIIRALRGYWSVSCINIPHLSHGLVLRGNDMQDMFRAVTYRPRDVPF